MIRVFIALLFFSLSAASHSEEEPDIEIGGSWEYVSDGTEEDVEGVDDNESDDADIEIDVDTESGGDNDRDESNKYVEDEDDR